MRPTEMATIRRAILAHTNLTRRQATVAALLYMRRTNSEVAAECGISIHTAKRHVEMVLLKLGVGSRLEVEGIIDAALDKCRAEKT